MKKNIIMLLLCWSVILSACTAECPPERISYEHDITLFPPQPANIITSPNVIEIKGKEILVDRVISGPLCNNTLSGTVYVTCDIQIPAREADAFFFQGCDLDVADDAIVYVEAHHDNRYDKGCSCHE
jgi:hypothetical protein